MKIERYLKRFILIGSIVIVLLVGCGFAYKHNKIPMPNISTQELFNKLDEIQSNRETTPEQLKKINELLRKHDMMQFKGK